MKPLLLALVFACTTSVFAQDGKLVFKVEKFDGVPVIQLKWYSQSLVYSNGVNLYRQYGPSGPWEKLNTSPIIRAKSIPEDILRSDSILAQGFEIVKGIPANQLEGILLLNCLLLSFEKQHFADYLGIFFEDATLATADRVRYKVNQILPTGTEELLAESEEISLDVETKIQPPQEIEFTQTRKTVRFRWQPEEDVYYGVNLYKKIAGQESFSRCNNLPIIISKEIKNGEETYPKVFFEDSDLKREVTYEYILRALSFFGEESAPSQKFIVQTKDETPPAVAPQNVHKHDVRKNKVIIAWSNPDYLEDVTLGVYRSKFSDTLFSKVNTYPLSPQDTTFSEIVQEGEGYYYYVAAEDYVGNQAPSSLLFIEVEDVTAPAIPVNLNAHADTGKIILRWDANTEKDLSGYRVYRTVNGDIATSYVPINAKDLDTNYYIDQLPPNAGNHFLYRVVAIDTSRNSSGRSEPASAKMPDVTPPAKPFIKRANYSQEKVIIEWISNVEADLLGYELYRRSAEMLEWTKINLQPIAADRATYADRMVSQNALYEYCLMAIDSAGNKSPLSTLYPIKTGAAQGGELVLKPSLDLKQAKKKKAIQLNWKHEEVPEEDFLGYLVFRKEDDGNYLKASGMLQEKSYKEKSLSTGKYTYQVRVYLQSGDVFHTNEENVLVE